MAVPAIVRMPMAESTDPRALLRLAREKVRDPWPLSRRLRKFLIGELVGIASNGTDHDKLAAIRLLLEMDRINLQEEVRTESSLG